MEFGQEQCELCAYLQGSDIILQKSAVPLWQKDKAFEIATALRTGGNI